MLNAASLTPGSCAIPPEVPEPVRGKLGAEAFCEVQGCITSAVAKVPNNPAIKIERSRVLPRSQAQGRHKPDLYNVLVEIDVSLIGQSSTYVFNCVHDGQLTVVQLMSIR